MSLKFECTTDYRRVSECKSEYLDWTTELLKNGKKLIFSIQPETQILTLGAALASKAQVLDDFIASNLLTQVHGDCKGWNLFFMKKSDLKEISAVEKSPVLFIDMQWTGVGHPLQVYIYLFLGYAALACSLWGGCLWPGSLRAGSLYSR